MPKRTDIRNAIKAAITGLTTTASRVYSSRTQTLNEGEINSLNIVTGEENRNIEEEGDFIRRLSINVEVRARQAADLDNMLDLIESEVFDVLDGSKLGGAAMDCRWVSASEPELSGEGETDIGLMIIEYEAVYAIN